MKKKYLFALILCVLISLSGCDLIGNIFGFGEEYSDEIYFWSVFTDDTGIVDVPVKRVQNDPIKIIMTRGSSGDVGFSTEEEARNELGNTSFTVWFDEVSQTGGSQEVMEQRKGWHLKQVFELTSAQKGQVYTIKGTASIGTDPVYEDLPWSFELTIR